MIKLATRFDSDSNEFLVLIRALYLLLINIYGAFISILKFFDLGYIVKCARTYSVWKDLVSEIVLRPIVRILVTLNLELDVSFLNEGTLSIRFKPQEVNVAKSKKVIGIRALYLLLLNIYGTLISILKFFDLGYVVKCARTYSVWKDLISEYGKCKRRLQVLIK